MTPEPVWSMWLRVMAFESEKITSTPSEPSA